MKLYLHIGYPRTGTSLLQRYLYNRHHQINYLGKCVSINKFKVIKFKPNIIEIINALLELSDDELNIKYDYLLEKIDALDLSETKTNIVSEECIILRSIHYPQAKDKKIETFLSRFEKLFKQKKIDVYYLFTIRKPSDIIQSLYQVSTIGMGSICYTPSELVESLSINKFDNLRLKIFINGFFYYKLYKHICSITKVNKIKVMVYEQLMHKPNEYIDELSNYFNIDNIISKKILNNKSYNTAIDISKEDIYTNNVFVVLYYKIKRHLKSPKDIIFSLDKKCINIFKLLFFRFPKKSNHRLDFNKYFNTISFSKKERKNFIINEKNKIIENNNLINKYYEEDLKLLQKELKLNLTEYNYFVN